MFEIWVFDPREKAIHSVFDNGLSPSELAASYPHLIYFFAELSSPQRPTIVNHDDEYYGYNIWVQYEDHNGDSGVHFIMPLGDRKRNEESVQRYAEDYPEYTYFFAKGVPSDAL